MSLLLSTSISGGTNYARTLQDSALVTDVALRSILAQRAALEALATQDAAARRTTLAREISELLALQDAAQRSLRDYRAPGDAAVVTDSVSSTITLGGAAGVNYERTTVDAVVVDDTAQRSAMLYRAAFDTADAADVAQATISGNAERTLSDSVDVSDAVLSIVTSGAIAAPTLGSRGGLFPNTLRNLRVVPDTREREEVRPRIDIRVALEAAQPIEMTLATVPRSTVLAAPIEDDSEFEEAAVLLLLAA
jgi:hypothetical protein